MGLIDRVSVAPDLDLPGFPDDPSEYEWQTKNLGNPMMDEYRIDGHGEIERLYKERGEKTDEQKAAEAREHGYNSWDEFADESPVLASELHVVDQWWGLIEYHGSFTIKTNDEQLDDRWVYELRYTEGELDDIVRLKPREL